MTKTIMTKRFNFAQSIGCDAVEPDNTGASEVRFSCTPAVFIKR